MIRPVTAGDHDQWAALYAAYAAFYGVEQTDEMRARVWAWLMDPTHEVSGWVAQSDTGLTGFAHARRFARPLAAATGLFLDDLFVDPAARGSGDARALIEAVTDAARREGHSVVRWITAEDNARARGLYDKVASQTEWVTYDITP